MSASLWVNFDFPRLRLCHEQATCAQPEALGLTNRESVSKKFLVVGHLISYSHNT